MQHLNLRKNMARMHFCYICNNVNVRYVCKYVFNQLCNTKHLHAMSRMMSSIISSSINLGFDEWEQFSLSVKAIQSK